MQTRILWLLLLFSYCGLGEASAQLFDKIINGLDKAGQVAGTIEQLSRSSKDSKKRGIKGFRVVSPNPEMDVQVVRCRASASTVVVDMLITYYGEDREFVLGEAGGDSPNTTLAYDDCGNQYDAESIGIRIANGNQEHYYGATALFPTEVPMKVQLEIKGVPESAWGFSRLYLKVRKANDPITIYNLPIARRAEMAQTMEAAPSLVEKANENFSEFEVRFVSDTAFQMSRILFDNLGFKPEEFPDEEPERLTPDNWAFIQHTLAQVKAMGGYKTERNLSENECANKIWIEDAGFLLEYTFTKIDGLWYLTYYFERA